MKSTWKLCVLGLISLPLMSCECQADPVVQHGDSYDVVVELLGQPEGHMVMADTTWLSFDRGTVKLVQNRVVEASLVSVEEARLRKAQEQVERERFQQVRAEQVARRLEEGRVLKLARMSDPSFLSTPASYQVAYWREFQRFFPEVSVNEEYAMALARLEAEQHQLLRLQEQEQRIRELENRVQVAEIRADRFRPQRFHSSVIVVPTRFSCFKSAPIVRCVQPGIVTRPHTLFTNPTRNFPGRHPGVSLVARSSL